jgi:hypothetical protein
MYQARANRKRWVEDTGNDLGEPKMKRWSQWQERKFACVVKEVKALRGR